MTRQLANPKPSTLRAGQARAERGRRSRAIQPALLLASMAALLGLAACPGSLSFDYNGGGMGGQNGADAGPIQLSCADSMNVLQTNCLSCHLSPPQALFASLDLMAANPATRLVGVAASSSGLCLGKGNLLNKTTLPATGILIDKINGHQTCGVLMPATGTLMSDTDIACLQAWANGLVSGSP